MAASILNGDSFAGVSIMLMDKDWIPGGAPQAQIPVLAYDNTEILTDKLSLVGAFMLWKPCLIGVWAGFRRARIMRCQLLQYRKQNRVKSTGPSRRKLSGARYVLITPGRAVLRAGRVKNLKIIEALPQSAVSGMSSGHVVILPDGSAGVGHRLRNFKK